MPKIQIVTAEEMPQRKRELTSTLSTGYDMQKLRIQIGNRICRNFRSKLEEAHAREGKENSDDVNPEVLDELKDQALEDAGVEVEGQEQKTWDAREDMKLLARVLSDYKLITDAVVAMTGTDGTPKLPRRDRFKPGKLITTYGELLLIDQYVSLRDQEKNHFSKGLPVLLQGIPVYEYYLKHVPGIGPALAALIINYLDIRKAKYVSSFYRYVGLDVVITLDENLQPVGRGRGSYKEHLVPKTYNRRDGSVTNTMGLSHNRFLKTKIVDTMVGSFLKQKERSPYSQVYYNYRNRLESDRKHDGKTAAHKHRMACRYVAKRFLEDLFHAWREIEGLPPVTSYAEAFLQRVHTEGADRVAQAMGQQVNATRLTRPVWGETKAV